MSWLNEWSALSKRIQGLIEAGHFLFLTTRDTRTQNRSVFLHIIKPYSEGIYKGIQNYLNTYRSSLSTAGIECIERFSSTWEELLRDNNWTKLHNVQSAITLLASFRSEFSFHLSDIQSISQRLTERAFVHLQRSIIADKTIRERWKNVYNLGGTNCEKLGAAHLLSHGIWAFKASAEGERTDLILGLPLSDMAQIEATASTLVLTEWKVVRDPKMELKGNVNQALKQAKRYSSGILAGFELKSYRYLTIVSENFLDLPPDVIENDITYRYINIAVDPSTPSRS